MLQLPGLLSAGIRKDQPQLWALHLKLLRQTPIPDAKFSSEAPGSSRGGVGEPATPCPASPRREKSPGAQGDSRSSRSLWEGARWRGGSLGHGAGCAGRAEAAGAAAGAQLGEDPARGAAPGSSQWVGPHSLSPLPCLQCRDWGRGEAILVSRQAESCRLCLASRGAPGSCRVRLFQTGSLSPSLSGTRSFPCVPRQP